MGHLLHPCLSCGRRQHQSIKSTGEVPSHYYNKLYADFGTYRGNLISVIYLGDI